VTAAAERPLGLSVRVPLVSNEVFQLFV